MSRHCTNIMYDIKLFSSKFLPSISLYPDSAIRYHTLYRIKTSISYTYRVYKECKKSLKLNIVLNIEGFSSISIQYRVYKEGRFGASSISYLISFRIGHQCKYIFFSSKAGASVPDHEIDFDNHCDYMDQDFPAGQFLSAQS